ncbi:MAG: hypothetical protein HQL98_11070 [Magnetococcales bacterium]|nr:hypothetical protein [Magnetococcales bacterium]
MNPEPKTLTAKTVPGGTLVPLWLSAALLTVTLGAPAPAKAEPTLTAVAAVSGAVALGVYFMTPRSGTAPAKASATDPGVPPPYVTQPYAAISPPYSNSAVIYSSVSPVAQSQPVAPQPQKVVQVVTAPVAYYAVPTPPVQMGTPDGRGF